MRRTKSIVAAALFAAAIAIAQMAPAQLPTPAGADPAPSTAPRTSPASPASAPVTPRVRADRPRDVDWQWTHRASRIIGSNVYNRQAEKLGDIEDIIVDPRRGQIRYAVVSIGGFLGIAEKLIAVPWRALQVDTDQSRYVMDGTKQRLKSAPGFDSNTWPDMDDPKWSQENLKFFDQRAEPRVPGEPAPPAPPRSESDVRNDAGAHRNAGKS
jgi:sporulation protein YlmC with PRC-barrel domain